MNLTYLKKKKNAFLSCHNSQTLFYCLGERKEKKRVKIMQRFISIARKSIIKRKLLRHFIKSMKEMLVS